MLSNAAIQTGPPRLPALTLWAGFGSTGFYQHWARLGGRVTHAVTLTDTYSTTLGFSKTVKVTGSNNSLAPRWNKVRIPVPYKPGFDYANVASYSVTVTNRGTADLRYTQLYLSQLLAVPPPVTVAPSPARGTVYELSGLPGSARAPVSLQFQQTGTRSYVRQFTVPGAAMWTCPPGVSSVAVYEEGGSGSGMIGLIASGTGGGGGGGSPAGSSGSVVFGRGGMVQLTYTSTLPGFQTLIAHRPPVTAPDSLLPFVSPSPSDVPDGTTFYPVGSLVPGVNARFAGTYTVVLVAWSWDTPTAARSISVGVTQNEQPGGATYYTQVNVPALVPSTLPVCSGTNANYGPLVVLGELTLPVQDLPQDNKNANFVVSISDSNTLDRFMDVLFLDTLGSTVLIQSPTVYANMGADAPPVDRDLGLIWGSLYDRDDAVSILDRATVAGGPITVDPDGNPHLLVYAAEGAPNCQMTYHPAWWLDRQS